MLISVREYSVFPWKQYERNMWNHGSKLFRNPVTDIQNRRPVCGYNAGSGIGILHDISQDFSLSSYIQCGSSLIQQQDW